MAEYRLAEHIDTSKIFLKNYSSLNNRLDAIFYTENILYENCIKLSKVAKVKGGKRIPLGFDYASSETNNLYLRVANMDEANDFQFSDFKYIDDVLYTILNRYEVYDNDLIISIAGTIGKVKILKKIPFDKRVILTENCAKIEIKNKNELNADYLKLVLQTNFVQKQIKLSYIQTTIPKLGLDKILGIYIPPIPSHDRQLEIVSIYEHAYISKQQKEAEAQALLDSIDSYLLGELGIRLPEQDNSLEKRIFRVSYSGLEYRHDPFYHKNINNIMRSSAFDEVRLKSIASIMKGQSITQSNIKEGNYPVIAGGQSSPYCHNEYNQLGNVITVSASGAYAGYVWYHNSPIFASDCSVIRSKDENGVQTLFLFEILKFKQQEIYRLQQGAGQPHVYPSDLAKIFIPLLPLPKQTEIVNHIQGIRNKAKQLQAEAQAILETAKQEVEKMILG